MYKTAIVLSTIPSINVFRAAITGAFSAGHLNHFLICSGFFHERTNKRGSFYASSAFAHAKLPTGSTVTVVGAYDPASTEFDDFVNTVRTSSLINGGGVTVSARRSEKKYANRWHAKIFIAREGDAHRFAVIGSSNLTRSAFNATASNNEADVIIWDDSHTPTRQIINAALNISDDPPSDAPPSNARGNPTVIVSTYEPDDARNTTHESMDARLKRIWDDVIMATK